MPRTTPAAASAIRVATGAIANGSDGISVGGLRGDTFIANAGRSSSVPKLPTMTITATNAQQAGAVSLGATPYSSPARPSTTSGPGVRFRCAAVTSQTSEPSPVTADAATPAPNPAADISPTTATARTAICEINQAVRLIGVASTASARPADSSRPRS